MNKKGDWGTVCVLCLLLFLVLMPVLHNIEWDIQDLKKRIIELKDDIELDRWFEEFAKPSDIESNETNIKFIINGTTDYELEEPINFTLIAENFTRISINKTPPCTSNFCIIKWDKGNISWEPRCAYPYACMNITNENYTLEMYADYAEKYDCEYMVRCGYERMY